ncbi:MAG: hypothetical protein ACFFAE_14315 [Candidatus Hodarchaeota archaeon]
MSENPSILDQLNSIIKYLNFHGHIFVRLASDHESGDIEGINISTTPESP